MRTQDCCSACPWWLWALLGLLLLLGLLSGLLYAFSDQLGLSKRTTKENLENTNNKEDNGNKIVTPQPKPDPIDDNNNDNDNNNENNNNGGKGVVP